MANKIPLKATYSGSNTSGLAEFQSGDTIDASFISGGLAPLTSPAFTGTPTAPTAAVTTNTTQLATTAFVRGEVTALVASAPGTLDTLNELAAALGDDANFSTTVTSSIATKLSLSGGTMTGNLNLGDNDTIQLGASQDLQLYHNGAHSYVRDNGTGDMRLLGTNLVLGNVNDSKAYLNASDGGAVDIRHNNSIKMSTTASGIDVTGNVAVSGTVDGVDVAARDGVLTSTTTTANAALPKAGGTVSGTVEFQNHIAINDNKEIRIGSGNDLRIYHDGSNSVIKDAGTGGIVFQADAYYFKNAAGTEYSTLFLQDNYAALYYDNTLRLKTTSSGVDITGNLVATGNVTAYSDERLKDDIQVIPNALSKVEAIRGVTFTRNDLETDERFSGVIAQEVEAVLPEVIHESEGGMKTVDYGNMVGLLIESVKELSARVKELEAR